MKRALAIAVALCTIGFAGFSQMFTGKWEATVCLIPDTDVTSTLTLNYSVAGLTITSITGIGPDAITSQKFTLKGTFGPLSLTGDMIFDVSAIAYMQSSLTTTLDFGGIAVTAKVEHWGGDYATGVCGQTVELGALKYTFTAKIAPITVKATFVDCCTGASFNDLTVTLADLGLCCGITYDVEFSFTKAGFQHLKFSLEDFAAICCGISFDLEVKFGVDYKMVTVTPSFAGFAEGCFEIYGDLMWDDEGDIYIEGIRIDGWKIACELGDCNYIEFVTFISPEYADDYGYDEFLGDCGEFEYIKMGFCGTGCCGGKYSVDLAIYFGADGGLFDVTRLVASVAIPVMSNFTLNIDASIPAAECTEASLCFGWTFTC